jgi:hypothetical protein
MNIVINEIQIPWNPDDQGVRYLGVLLDKKLNWNIHVNTNLIGKLVVRIPLAVGPVINSHV